MTTATATLATQTVAKTAATPSWKRIIRRALETLGKHYAYGPYTL
ncbi:MULTISPECIES: hypothetical protein [Duganella]|jgi:hypothetical protein|nr:MULTISPECIES: hypothetical protein [Duganella]